MKTKTGNLRKQRTQTCRWLSVVLLLLCSFMLFSRACVRSMSSSLHRHVIWEWEGLVAYLHPRPWTPGSVILEGGGLRGSLFHLEGPQFVKWLLGARRVAELLCDRLHVHRCALVCRPHTDRPVQIHILPLHGLDTGWRPHLAAEEEYNAHDPGYCTSKSAPRWSPSQLSEIQTRIRAQLPIPDAAPDLSFLGEDPAHPGLFSRIVRGEEQQWRVWEDEAHVAFLTPFPNSPGFTVLVPRRPLTSDVFRLEEDDYRKLALAAQEVSRLLEDGLGAWAVGLIFEGFEIDYAHAKLIPLFLPPSASDGDHQGMKAVVFNATYPGFVTSQDGPEASAHTLQEMHAKITQT